VPDTVLDASALLAFVKGERGSTIVGAALANSAISSVNLAEVITRLLDWGMSLGDIQTLLGKLPIEVAIFHGSDAYAAAALRSSTRHAGLSLGDRACLALAQQRGLPALTTDRAWTKLSVGVVVRLVRN
jgi:PIN domain nuclease of toxin-antitoxin system